MGGEMSKKQKKGAGEGNDDAPRHMTYMAALQHLADQSQRELARLMPHYGERGRIAEEIIKNVLARTLPKRFSIGTGVIFSADGQVAGISQTAAQRVAKHIEQHGMAVHGERWIKYGLDHIEGGNCPFCSRDIEHVDLVGAFRDFFSEAYSEHTQQVEETGQGLKALREDGPTGIDAILAQNAVDFAFWNDFAEFSVLPEIAPEQIVQVEEGIALLGDRFDTKMASPLSQIKLTSDREKIAKAFEVLGAYNNEVRGCLDEIERVRREVQQADPAKAEAVLNSKKAIQAKAVAPLSSNATEYLSLVAIRRELNSKKADLQTELRAYAGATLHLP
jgi:wobble nucleotide-excising tRNase